jgi:hypothetical protein
MSAPTLLTVSLSLRTSLDAALVAQVRASEAQAANTRASRSTETADESAVPVSIPAMVTASMERLEVACGELSQMRVQRAVPRTGRPRQAARKVLPGRYRKTWNTLGAQLRLWRDSGALAKLSETSRAALTRTFGAALTVPRFRVDAQAAYTLGDETLRQMRTGGVHSIITSLGGELLLANIESVHADLSAAFGVSSPVSVPAPSESSTDAFARVRAALCEYVLKVHAMVGEEVPGSSALAARLLAPLNELPRAKNAATKTKKTAKETVATPATPKSEPVATGGTATPAAAPALRPTGT